MSRSNTDAEVLSSVNEAEYSEEEVEVTDDEDAEAPAPTIIAKAPATAPGKVKASSAVSSMKMRSPQQPQGSPAGELRPDKSPFSSVGTWTQENLDSIEIVFPVLSSKNETTNDLTRNSRPEARYWKGPIMFKYSTFQSDTLRFDNVHIPYHNGNGYGTNFVYMCLPGVVGDAFAEAGKRVAPTRVTEASLAPDSVRWWKIANKVDSVFGVINNANRKFQTKSLATIFGATQSGVTCSVTLRFFCKASTDEKAPLSSTTVRTVSVEVVRAYISEVDVSVQMPAKVSRAKIATEPMATSKDIASDSLMQRLAGLGL